MEKGVRGVDPEWYTPANQENEPEPARYWLAPLSQLQMVAIVGEHLQLQANGEHTVGPEGIAEAFRLGVRKWQNIEDGDAPGTPLLFSRSNMGKIPWPTILEVGARVLELTALGSEERKNSSSPSPSVETPTASPVSPAPAIARAGGV
jgi:hypothetical protein